MRLQNIARTPPVNIPLLYVCQKCGTTPHDSAPASGNQIASPWRPPRAAQSVRGAISDSPMDVLRARLQGSVSTKSKFLMTVSIDGTSGAAVGGRCQRLRLICWGMCPRAI